MDIYLTAFAYNKTFNKYFGANLTLWVPTYYAIQQKRPVFLKPLETFKIFKITLQIQIKLFFLTLLKVTTCNTIINIINTYTSIHFDRIIYYYKRHCAVYNFYNISSVFYNNYTIHEQHNEYCNFALQYLI